MELNTKQTQILQIAEKLFAENGYDGTSVRQIAREADINVAMISYYFGSKEKLLSALLIYRTADFKIHLESVLSAEKSFLKKVDEIVELSVRRIHANRRMYKIIHFEYSSLCRSIDFENYLNQKKENYKLIESFVKEGQKSGIFSKSVNIQLIVPTILGTYFNFYYNKRFFSAMHPMDEEKSFDDYIFNVLTPHIQRTIKALLTYEE